MDLSIIVIIILAAAVAFFAFFLIKYVLIPQRAAAAASSRNKSKLRQTIRAAKSAIESDPQNAEAHFLLGRAYLADNREEQAFREFKSVNRLGIGGKNIPETEYRESIAALYAKFHEEEEALKEYALLIKSNPEKPDYFFQAGKLFANRGRADLAEQYLRKAVSLNPREGNYRFELGMLYYLGKRLKEAGAEFEATLKLDPSNGQVLLYMGKILKDAKDFAGAVPYLEKASRDQEQKLRALVELGGCYMSLKTLDKAIPELERAVAVIETESEPDSLYARYFLSLCYEKTGEYAKAIEQWDKIRAVKKSFRDVGEKLIHYSEYRQEAAPAQRAASGKESPGKA